MITATSTPIATGLRLEIKLPDHKRPVFADVKNEAEGVRLVYFRTRSYIIEKLSGWLRQRMYAARQSGDGKLTDGTAQLLVKLGYYSEPGMKGLCAIVVQHRADLESVAPGKGSRFYNHYQQVIIPIISYCQNYKEE